MSVTVLLADDHSVVREGIRLLLERDGIRVVGEVGDGRSAVELARRLEPNVAMLDLSMPVLNGLEAARQIARAAPRVRTILLTVHTWGSNVLDALRAGVRGYVLKTQPIEELRAAIEAVARGEMYLSPAVSQAVVNAYLSGAATPIHRLSPRERQVLLLVAEGRSTKEVAVLLGVTTKTAETHRGRVMKKLGVHSTAALVRYAIREGLITP